MVHRIERLGFGYLGSRIYYFKNEKFKSGWIDVINRRESVWRGFGEGIIYFGIMSRRGGLLSWPGKQLKKVEPFEKKICRIV